MKFIITGDLHLADAPLDEYKWRIFPWLERQTMINAGVRPDAVLILGDLTNAKDNHGAKLVNRIVESLGSLSDLVPVYILMGNHDYIDPLQPYFQFLNQVGKGITYIRETTRLSIAGAKCLFIPHGCNANDGLTYSRGPGSATAFDLVCFHRLLEGADLGNGRVAKPESQTYWLPPATLRVGGDVHIPQQMRFNDTLAAIVHYVGAPYPVNFGDTYEPRVICWGGHKDFWNQVPPHAIKASIISGSVAHLGEQLRSYHRPTDSIAMVKLKWLVKRGEYGLFMQQRAEIKKCVTDNHFILAGLEVMAVHTPDNRRPVAQEAMVDPKTALIRFADERGTPQELLNAGIELIHSE